MNNLVNMTGEPNQENRPSVFGADFSYPLPNSQWNNFTSELYNQQNFPFISNYGPSPVTFPINTGINNIPNGFQVQESLNYTTLPVQNIYQPPQLAMENDFRSFPSTSQEYQKPTSMRCKRKTDSPELREYKQHITEEKMAEHLSKLHISSQTPPENEKNDTRLKRLYMCDEMLKLQTESILPASLTERKPCTALVLWTPPPRMFPDDSDSDNNNQEEVPDNNLMDLDQR